MKKMFVVVLIIILMINLSACGNVEGVDYNTKYESIEEAVEDNVGDDVEIIDYIRNQNVLAVTYKHNKSNGVVYLCEYNNKYYMMNGSIIVTETIKVLSNGKMWVVGYDHIGGEYYTTIVLDKEYNVRIDDNVLEKMKYANDGFLYYYILDKNINLIEIQIDEETFFIDW